MSWSPVSVGDGRPSEHTFTTDTAKFPLTGVSNASIAMHMTNVNTGVLQICTGTWNVTDAANGIADFTPSVADVTTGPLGVVGIYNTYPVVTLASGPCPMDAQLILVRLEG